MRVFLVEKPRSVDIDDVAKHGKVTFLFGDDARRTSVLKCDVFMRDVTRRLNAEKFDPRHDKFCITPPILPSSLALGAVVKYCGNHPMTLLVFNASTGLYEERDVDLESL